jgi:hypothetical protein
MLSNFGLGRRRHDAHSSANRVNSVIRFLLVRFMTIYRGFELRIICGSLSLLYGCCFEFLLPSSPASPL